MIDGFVALYIFMLAAFVGYEVISRVPVILHTPLMSGSNFIHGIVLVGAMVALARRATEGGSWLVRASLAQTGRWLVDRGQVPEGRLGGVAREFTDEEIGKWCTVSDTPSGRLTHLAPVLELSETKPYWARPTVPLGHHEPVWP